MRLMPWRGIQSKGPASAADQAQLHERLARLAGGPGAAEATIPPEPKATIPTVPDPVSTPAESVAEPVLVTAPISQAASGEAPAGLTTSPYVAVAQGDDKDRRRRRRLGFFLFFAGLILVFFVVRAIPSDWEIGPFKIDANGSAADAEASLYFADDPHAPFWLLVPTFNLPPRFFAARPSSSRPAVALAPTQSPTPSSSASTSPSATPAAPASPTASPS